MLAPFASMNSPWGIARANSDTIGGAARKSFAPVISSAWHEMLPARERLMSPPASMIDRNDFPALCVMTRALSSPYVDFRYCENPSIGGIGESTTVVITSAVYSTFAAAFLSGSIGGGAVVGIVFGVARAATLLAAARVKSPAGVVAVDSAFQRWERPSRRASTALVATLALTAAAAAVASLA